MSRSGSCTKSVTLIVQPLEAVPTLFPRQAIGGESQSWAPCNKPDGHDGAHVYQGEIHGPGWAARVTVKA